MFKKCLKKTAQFLGYEFKKVRVKSIQIDEILFDDSKEVRKFTSTKHMGTSKAQVDVSDSISKPLIIESPSLFEKELSIDAIYKKQGCWGFVRCFVGDLNFLMFLGGKDDGVALRFLHNRCYEKKTMRLWVQIAKGASMVLDIGAHTGSYTIAAKLANLNASVFSFEPHYLNYARLSLNLRANGLATDETYMMAISDSNKKVMFSVPRGVDYHSSGGYVGVGIDRENYYVTSLALDDYFDKKYYHQIDLIKIDTEGHELSCLLGMKNIISTNFPTIFFECISVSGSDLEELLLSFDYEIFLVNDNTGEVSLENSVLPKFDDNGNLLMSSINRIAIHPSKNLKLK